MIPVTQNDISSLNRLSVERYENLFKVYQAEIDNKKFYYYNITNKLILPEELNSEILDKISFDRNMPWTIVAQRLYSSIYLWYILFMLNFKTVKSKFFVSAGEEIVYIKPEYIDLVVSKLNE
jgi:hypothetical protein